MTGNLRLAVAGLGAAAVTGIAGTVGFAYLGGGQGASGLISLAASKSATPAAQTRNKWCTDFVNHLERNLGVSDQKLQASFKGAIDQTISDAVAARKLTPPQAARLRTRLENRQLCQGFSLGRDREGSRVAMKSYIDAAAQALHLSTAALNAQLKGGKSLSQIAAAQNVTESQFRASLIAALSPKLAQAVTDKDMTAAQEQRILQRLRNGRLPLWNRPAPAAVRGGPAAPTATS